VDVSVCQLTRMMILQAIYRSGQRVFAPAIETPRVGNKPADVLFRGLNIKIC